MRNILAKYGWLAVVLLALAAVAKPVQCPGPGPAPGPTPQPGALNVLFVYESKDLPPAQADVLNSRMLREYLDAHCAKDGTQPAYRFLDKDADPSKLSAKWQAAWAKAKGKPVPWMEIDNGTSQFSGPWGPDAAATLAILKQYGGD